MWPAESRQAEWNHWGRCQAGGMVDDRQAALGLAWERGRGRERERERESERERQAGRRRGAWHASRAESCVMWDCGTLPPGMDGWGAGGLTEHDVDVVGEDGVVLVDAVLLLLALGLDRRRVSLQQADGRVQLARLLRLAAPDTPRRVSDCHSQGACAGGVSGFGGGKMLPRYM